MAPQLLPRFPVNFNRYVEPFCGSASLFFLLEPQSALLSDVNAELINTLKQIRCAPTLLAQICQDLPHSKEDYYSIRSFATSELNGLHRAARFLYLNRLCFNGLYRTNLNGIFNVPYSGVRTPPPVSVQELRQAARLLKRAMIRRMDFTECIALADKDDFYYIDPPYASNQQRFFTEYQATPFVAGDLSTLHLALRTLDKKGTKFMLSYGHCEEIALIAREWNSNELWARRNIAGFVGSRKKAVEVVVTNY